MCIRDRLYVNTASMEDPVQELMALTEGKGYDDVFVSVSYTHLDVYKRQEMEKVRYAVDMGAEAIMDLSSFGDTQTFRRKLVEECPAILGTVPIYDAVVYYNKALKDITTQEWLEVFRMHAEDGVDFMTIHCGINRQTAARFKKQKRDVYKRQGLSNSD